MKKLKKLNLSSLGNMDMEKREMSILFGGANCCICACHGSSSTGDNSSANNAGGYSSSGGGTGSGSFGM